MSADPRWLAPIRVALDAAPDASVRWFVRDDDPGWADDRLRALLDTTAAAGAAVDLAAIPAALGTRTAGRLRRMTRGPGCSTAPPGPQSATRSPTASATTSTRTANLPCSPRTSTRPTAPSPLASKTTTPSASRPSTGTTGPC